MPTSVPLPSLEVFAEVVLPDAPRALVQLVHGMAEHSGRYTEAVQALTRDGFAVALSDHRGHGRSPGIPFHLADRDGWSVALQDLHAVTLAAREATGLNRVVLLGHSMGSFLARDYARSHGQELAGLVLSGTGGPLSPIERLGLAAARAQVRLAGPRSRAVALTRATYESLNRPFRPGRTRFDWLCRDEARVDTYLADPCCGGTCTAGFLRDLLGAIETTTTHPLRLPPALPVLLLSGASDPMVKGGRVVLDLAGQLVGGGSRSVTARLYPGARHEVLAETSSTQVLGDLLSWLQEQVG